MQKFKHYSYTFISCIIFIMASYQIYIWFQWPNSPQSMINFSVTQYQSWKDILYLYPKVYAPFYAVIIYFFKFIVPITLLNLGLFWINCLLASQQFKLNKSSVSFFLILNLVFCSHYFNIKQLTAESLFITILFCFIHKIKQFQHQKCLRHLIGISVLCSLLGMTRYFGFLWAYPCMIFYILFLNIHWKQKMKFLGIFSSITLTPLMVWILRNYQITGYFSGMDRFGSRGMNYDQISELTSGLHNIQFTLKTIYIDFCSPFLIASHEVINHAYSLKWIDYLILSYLILGFILNLKIFFQIALKQNRLLKIYLITIASYLICLIFIWTFTNNDPLYSRFFYPIYFFIMGVFFMTYQGIQKHLSNFQLFYWKGFYLLFLSLHIFKLWIFTIKS